MIENLSRYDDLIKKYATAGPRYTSYPTANHFDTDFNPVHYLDAASSSNVPDRVYGQMRPLSLYIHIPFCNTVCYYCGCNKIVTKDKSKAIPYLERLHREIALQGDLFDPVRPVEQLHFGGGTPTFISIQQMRDLFHQIAAHFRLLDDDSGEYSIEVDPRDVDAKTLSELRSVGFNRISFGVQDFNCEVQKAVNREQSQQHIFELIRAAREFGFQSVSVDLIYGLPLQTPATFRQTIELLIQADPDRVSIFNYAHLPQMFKPQRRINEADLPSAADKLAILKNFVEQLGRAGYAFIGMDHFAKPTDELALAQAEGRLHRNFQGYSTHANCDMVGLGISSIGKVNNCYAQNEKTAEAYYAKIDKGQLALTRGKKLYFDDLIRHYVIMELMCQFTLDKKVVEYKFGVEFDKYFAAALCQLTEMQKDGLVSLSDRQINVEPSGRWFIRNICMTFDAYLQSDKGVLYSKVV